MRWRRRLTEALAGQQGKAHVAGLLPERSRRPDKKA